MLNKILKKEMKKIWFVEKNPKNLNGLDKKEVFLNELIVGKQSGPYIIW